MLNEYTFTEMLNPNLVINLAKAYKWGGEIDIVETKITSERPIPRQLYDILLKFRAVCQEPLYEDVRKVYESILQHGESSFGDIDLLFGKYGFAAHIVLAETMVYDEVVQCHGRRIAERLLKLTLRKHVQPRLF